RVACFGGEEVDACGHVREVIRLVKLIAEAVVNVNLFRAQPRRHQVAHGLGHDRVRGDAPGAAYDVDLDADDVVAANELATGINGVSLASQLAHPALHHFAHHLRLNLLTICAQALV